MWMECTTFASMSFHEPCLTALCFVTLDSSGRDVFSRRKPQVLDARGEGCNFLSNEKTLQLCNSMSPVLPEAFFKSLSPVRG